MNGVWQTLATTSDTTSAVLAIGLGLFIFSLFIWIKAARSNNDSRAAYANGLTVGFGTMMFVTIALMFLVN